MHSEIEEIKAEIEYLKRHLSAASKLTQMLTEEVTKLRCEQDFLKEELLKVYDKSLWN